MEAVGTVRIAAFKALSALAVTGVEVEVGEGASAGGAVRVRRLHGAVTGPQFTESASESRAQEDECDVRHMEGEEWGNDEEILQELLAATMKGCSDSKLAVREC